MQVNAQVDTGSTYALPINPVCVTSDAFNVSDRRYVYDAVSYKDMQIRSSCDIDSFLAVDFDRYLLLSLLYSYSGCERNVKSKMTYSIDHPNKKLILYLSVYEKGPCRPMYYRSQLFLIPRIPASYSIEIYKPRERIPQVIPGE